MATALSHMRHGLIHHGTFIVFLTISYTVLAVMNGDGLRCIEENNEWSSSPHYLDECLLRPGGWLGWAGAYLTQFFHIPWLGTLMLLFLWMVVYALTIKVCRLEKGQYSLAVTPLVLLLASVLSPGYWMYVVRMNGYWFSMTLGTILLLLTLYPFSVCAKNLRKHKVAWLGLVAAHVVGIFTYKVLKANFPLHYYHGAESWSMAMPILCLYAFLVPLPFLRRILPSKPVVNTVVVLVISIFFLHRYWYRNANFQSEQRMMIALEEQRWDDILTEPVGTADSPTRQMVLMKNIALMKLGELGDKTFHYSNAGVLPGTTDSLPVRLIHVAGPELLYHHGMTRYSYRWCMENGIKCGFSPRLLRMMIRCAILDHEPQLAYKYVKRLRQATFHKEEAIRYETLLHHLSDVTRTPEFSTVLPYMAEENTLDDNEGDCDRFLTEALAFSTSMRSEKADAICTATLVARQKELFWRAFMNYGMLNIGREIPLHYQEAAFMFALEDDNDDVLKQIDFDLQKIVERYNQFQRDLNTHRKLTPDVKAVRDALEPEYGDTYWWYYFLCTDVEYY